MPLTGQAIDIPLIAQNQQAPETSAPVGRLKSLINGVGVKFQAPQAAGAPQAIRVEKRAGFKKLTGNVQGPHFADTSEAALGAPSLMATLGDQLVIVDNANPCVLAEHAPCWERFPYALPTNGLSVRPVFTANNQIAIPDGAAAGDVSMFSWSTIDGQVQAMILDNDGTPVAQPTNFGTAYRSKVVSDGTTLFLFTEQAGVLALQTFAKNGAIPGGATLGAIIPGSEWDATFDSVRGVVLAWRSNVTADLHITFVSAPAGVVTLNDTHDASINSGHAYAGSNGVAWLTSDRADGFVYLVAREVSNAITGYQINGSGVATHTYTVAASVAAVNACGFVAPTGNADLTIWLSVLGAGGNPFLNQIRTYTAPFGSAASFNIAIKAMSLASRAFRMGGHYYCATYYQSFPSIAFSNGRGALGQPTYFFHAMDQGAFTSQMVGRFEYARAAAAWQTNLDPRDTTGHTSLAFDAQWHLSSVFSDAEGVLHMPLGYNVETFAALVSQGGDTGGQTFTASLATVGIRDYMLGGPGQAVEYAGELFLPGPMATSFTGYAFSEHGVSLSPEGPQSITGATTGGGGLTADGFKRTYVFVFEWTNPNGDRARSATSIPFTVISALTGGQNSYVITGYPNHLTTHTDMLVSIYRNFIDPVTGTLSTSLRKITNDLKPSLVNDPTADTWTFTDTVSDAACQVGEPLYTTPGATVTALQREPCPAFSGKPAVFQNRVFVLGWDGAIWYSAEKTPGEAIWFNSDALKFYMPTSDPLVALDVLDNRLIIFCRESVWFITGGGFPDGTGQNSRVPTPQQLPFSNGCSGFTNLASAGVVYSRTVDNAAATPTGGVWLVTRDLQNVQLAAPAVDDLLARTIRGLVQDVDQRLLIAHDLGEECFDTISGVWSAWVQPTAPVYATVWRGRLTYIDVAGGVWTQDPALVADGPGATPIITTTEVMPMNFMGVRSYKRVWELHFYGQRRGDHDLTVTITYYGEDGTLTSVHAFTPDAVAPFEYAPPLTEELVRALGLKFVDSFPRGATAGYALEHLGAYVGLEKGLNRLPSVRKIAPTG